VVRNEYVDMPKSTYITRKMVIGSTLLAAVRDVIGSTLSIAVHSEPLLEHISTTVLNRC
jgi:hypothetical protein